jgi:hypothetical protein
LNNLKPGDEVHFSGVSSFTASKKEGEAFATGTSTGQRLRGRARPDPSPGILFEVEAGARGLRVAALSPWKNQQEVLSLGKFEVVSVSGDPPTRFKRPKFDPQTYEQVGEEFYYGYERLRWDQDPVRLRIKLRYKG